MSDNTTNNKRIARNSIYMAVRTLIVLAITLYTTRVALNVLGVNDYGIYNVVCGFVALFGFLSTSMSNAIQRFYNYEIGKENEDGLCDVFNTAILIQLIIAIIIVIIVEVFGDWYISHKLVVPMDRMHAVHWIFQCSVLSFFFVILRTPFNADIIAHERMDFVALVSVLDAILKLSIVLFIPIISIDRLICYGILMAGIELVNLILNATYAGRKFSEIKLTFRFNQTLFKSILSFSGWNIFGSFSGIMKEQGINLVLNLFFGPVVNAARGVAAQINAGLQSFVTSITIPVRPQVIQSYAKGNLQRTFNLTFSVSKMSCLFLYVMALPALTEIDYILSMWLGGNVPENTNSFVKIIVLTSFLNNLNAAVSGVIHASGKMKLYQLSTSLTALLCIPLSYLLLTIYHKPVLALWSVFITMLMVQIIAIGILKYLVPEFSIIKYCNEVVYPFVLIVLLSIWVPTIIVRTLDPGFIRFLTVVVVSVLTVAIETFYIAMKSEERNLFVSFIKSKFHLI